MERSSFTWWQCGGLCLILVRCVQTMADMSTIEIKLYRFIPIAYTNFPTGMLLEIIRFAGHPFLSVRVRSRWTLVVQVADNMLQLSTAQVWKPEGSAWSASRCSPVAWHDFQGTVRFVPQRSGFSAPVFHSFARCFDEICSLFRQPWLKHVRIQYNLHDLQSLAEEFAKPLPLAWNAGNKTALIAIYSYHELHAQSLNGSLKPSTWKQTA